MRLRAKVSKPWRNLKGTHCVFPSEDPFLHGKSASGKSFMPTMVNPRPQSKDTQIAKPSFIISVMRNSSVSRSLQMSKVAHSTVLRTGFDSNLFITNNLLQAYWSNGSISNALKMFYEMWDRDVVSWNIMISGFIAAREFKEGFSFYSEMKHMGIRPSQSSFVSLLVASVRMGSFRFCRQIHGESLKQGFSSDLLVGNALLTAYVKCGDVNDSRKVFDELHSHDEVSFEILLGGYLGQGNMEDSFELFRYSCLIGVPLSQFSLSSLISSCTSTGLMDRAIQIHRYIIKVGLDSDISVVNSLITMYAKFFHLEDASCLFDRLESRDIVTWNSMIAGYAFNSQGDAAIGLFANFLSMGMRMNESTFLSFLSSCATVTIFENAKMAHGIILKMSDTTNQGIDNIILTMYCRCKSFRDAINVFHMMEDRDAISFNILFGSFRERGQYEEAVGLLRQMQLDGFKVDEFVYSSLISSCSKLADLEIGLQIHSCIIKTGFEKIPPLGNSLLEMYSHCGSFDEMEKIFGEIDVPDVFTWNTMVMGYAHLGFFCKSIRIWGKMIEAGVVLNEFSYCIMLDICSHIEDPVMGEQMHARIEKLGVVSDTALMNSLLTMYSNCGMVEKASSIFTDIRTADSISWNAMICGYAQNGYVEESLRFYLLMSRRGLKPNHLTFVSISKPCTLHVDLLLGLQFHAQVIKTGFESDVLVSNSFIAMYAKCGSICESSKIFRNTLNFRDVITWNSMICGYAHHGCGREALDTYSDMKFSGEKPNAVTFLGLLSACSHAGLVAEAWTEFKSMYHDYGIIPTEEHYACMVDILCRAGNLKEAKDLIESIPFNPFSLMWRTLLSACRTHENVRLGEEAAVELMQLEAQDSSAYVLLSNIYASVENMEKKVEIRRRMKDKSVKKESGCSWIWC